MPADFDAVKLQLTMAFGQGAGAILADGEALQRLISEQNEIIRNALASWAVSRYAFTDLVRLLGQLSAARATGDGRAEISWDDIERSLPAVREICPCLERSRRPDGR